MNKTSISLGVPLVIYLACSSPALAQYGSPFLKVDTVTTGECDDLHPVLDQNFQGFNSSQYQWLAFERRTDEESAIAVKKYIPASSTWDTSVTIVSKRFLPEEEKLPQISVMSSHGGNRQSVLAWQRKTDNVWNICYSIFRNDSSGWSQPIALTSDSVNNTNVLLRAYRDSTVIFAWKKKNVVLYTLVTPSSFKPPDTLAISNSESLEFDFTFYISDGGVVWTSSDTGSNSSVFMRQITTYPSFSLTTPETLALRGRLHHPQFAFQFPGYHEAVSYEAPADSASKNHEIFVWDGHTALNLSKDANADSRNAKTFVSPVITASSNRSSEPTYFWYDALVMEKYVAQDSFLIFQRNAFFFDTLAGPGHNRDACIASGIQYVPKYFSAATLIVWESNRTGRPHIYSRLVLVPTGDVKRENRSVHNFELMQSFPNPFNPTTTIRFHLPTSCFTFLRIFDLLGREVQTLIGEKLSAGEHSATWDGREFSSGVYLYRLQAGDFVETKKLILIK